MFYKESFHSLYLYSFYVYLECSYFRRFVPFSRILSLFLSRNRNTRFNANVCTTDRKGRLTTDRRVVYLFCT